MQLPATLPPLPSGPVLKKYILISLGILILIIGFTVWIAYQTRISLIYKTATIAAVVKDTQQFKDQTVALSGTFIPASAIKKPLCVPIGRKQFPELVSGYKSSPTSWGLYNGTDVVGVKIINNQGQEVNKLPDFSYGESLNLKGTLRATTAVDDCNLDIQYPSAYLEVSPAEVGLE